MRFLTGILLFLLGLFMTTCSQKETTSEEGPLGESLEPRKLEGSLSGFAETFDKYVQGKLSESEVASLKQGCQTNAADNIFCNSMNRGDVLDKRIRARIKTPRSVEVTPVRPAEIEIVDGKVPNWQKLRRVNVKSLLKGLLGKPIEDLQILKKLAVRERRCPNNMAVVVGATLEDFLPDKAMPSEIAGLYEKAADCLKKGDGDRETYYTRAGLLQYFSKNYKVAAIYFQRAARVPNAFASRALHWLYRSYKEMGDEKGAEKALAQLLSKYPYSFHTLVLATASGKDPGDKYIKPGEDKFLKRSKRVANLNLLIEQAEILKAGGFDSSAALLAEWAVAESWKAESDIRIYIATLGDAALKITVAADIIQKNPKEVPRSVLELYFPRAFFELFEKQSGSLDPFILLSVARQESTLNDKAVSPANAQGLLQIHPDTGKKVMGKEVDLFDPEQNVTAGSRYLSDLLGKLQNQIHLALAAYNAGEEKLGEWSHRYPTTDPILFVDLISYRETRNYVASVLRNYYWYRRLHGGGAELVKNIVDPSVAKKN